MKVIIRRLQRAMAERKIRDNMDIEDEIVEVLDNKDRAIYKQAELIKDQKKEIDDYKKEIEVQKKVNAEKDKLIEELKNKIPKK